MRRAPFCCLFLLVVIAALSARAAELPAVLKDVKRIVVLGDSITQAGDYVTDLECWFAAQDIAVEVISLGLGSEAASDLTPEENQDHLTRHGFGPLSASAWGAFWKPPSQTS